MSRFEKNILEGKTALITGAGGILGPRHAKALASVGANLILLDISEKNLRAVEKNIRDEFSSINIDTYIADISKLGQIKNISENIVKENKKVDILINNAALNPQMLDSEGISGMVESYDMDQWNAEINVGLTGTFICSRVFGEMMAKNNSGVIINISSDLAIRAPDQRVYSPTESYEDIQSFKPIGYSVIKTALIGMTKYLAEYWGYKGVRVNALLPGGIYSGQANFIFENVKKRTLLGRWAKIDEYEDAIVFLASDASAYMTGQSIVMDGGRSV